MRRFKNILCVLDPSKDQESALERAVTLAESNQARLTLAEAGVTTETLSELSALHALSAPYQERVAIHHAVLQGSPAQSIMARVSAKGHDLLIKQAEHPSLIERLLGSEDIDLLRHCPCPVWLMQDAEPANYGCILAAIDFDPDALDEAGSALNGQILELASSLALSDFAALHVIHAWDAPGETLLRTRSDTPDATVAAYLDGLRAHHQGGLEQLMERLRAAIGDGAFTYLAPRLHLRQGQAHTLIPEVVRALEADVVILGTAARAGLAGLLLGNTAETLLGGLDCALLVVKPPPAAAAAARPG